MKANRVVGIIFTVINIILVALCVAFYLRADRTAPKFTAQAAEVIYSPDMDKSELLYGITAYDAVDGDVTDRIVIEKTIEDSEAGTAVVFFAVSDRAGNVAKFSKEFPAVFENAESRGGSAGYVEDLEAGEVSAKGSPGEEAADSEGSDPSGEDAEADSAASSSQEPVEEDTPSPTQSPTPSPTMEPTAEPTPTPTTAPTLEPTPKVDPAAPVLTLKMSEVKTKAGTAPAWVNLIQTLRDDKDSYEALFNNLSVSKYDVNKAGTYQVSVSTEDSDGNRSAAVPLTIIVE